jgi:hypothetical protein
MPGPHTTTGTISGVPYARQPLDSAVIPPPRADVYRIETFTNEQAPTRIRRYVPGRALDRVLARWNKPCEIVVDVQPMTKGDAAAEIRAARLDQYPVQLLNEVK